MDRNKHFQFDFFSQQQQNKGDRDKLSHISPCESVRHYEKGLLLAIGVVIIASIAYTAGMKHGKQKTLARSTLSAESQTIAQEVRSEPQVPESPALDNLRNVVQAAPVEEPAEAPAAGASYTIQLAAYATSSYAEREAERLKKQGFTPLLEKKGQYVVLSVGKFPSKEAAQKLLKSQFEARYTGCFARRL